MATSRAARTSSEDLSLWKLASSSLFMINQSLQFTGLNFLLEKDMLLYLAEAKVPFFTRVIQIFAQGCQPTLTTFSAGRADESFATRLNDLDMANRNSA